MGSPVRRPLSLHGRWIAKGGLPSPETSLLSDTDEATIIPNFQERKTEYRDAGKGDGERVRTHCQVGRKRDHSFVSGLREMGLVTPETLRPS